MNKPPSVRAALLAAASSLCVIVALCACSVKDNYRTLSFFFDGVPNPDAPRLNSVGLPVVADLQSSPTYSVHKPYQQERCEECHKGSFDFTPADTGACLKCHPKATSDHTRMHGPVAAAACTWCHTGHESAEAHLMKGPSRAVCTQCHEPGLLLSDGVAEHADTSRACLDCHFGHGGDSVNFLRAGRNGVRSGAGATPPGGPAAR